MNHVSNTPTNSRPAGKRAESEPVSLYEIGSKLDNVLFTMLDAKSLAVTLYIAAESGDCEAAMLAGAAHLLADLTERLAASLDDIHTAIFAAL